MGLNRSEEILWEYVQRNPDERQHWQEKVQRLTARLRDRHELALSLESELRRYYEERTHAVKALGEKAEREGLHRASMRNLAEYLLQVWAPAPIKPRSGEKN